MAQFAAEQERRWQAALAAAEQRQDAAAQGTDRNNGARPERLPCRADRSPSIAVLVGTRSNGGVGDDLLGGGGTCRGRLGRCRCPRRAPTAAAAPGYGRGVGHGQDRWLRARGTGSTWADAGALAPFGPNYSGGCVHARHRRPSRRHARRRGAPGAAPGEHTAAAEAAASALVERSAAHWTTLAAAVAADGADGRVAAAAHAATAADHAATAQHTLETGLGAVATTVRSGNRTLLVTRWTADSSVPPLFLQLILPRSPPPRGRRVWCTLARASCWLAFGVPLSRWRYGRRQRVRAGGAVRELTPGSWRARICVAPPQSPTASPMATSLSQSMGPTPPSAVLGLAKSRTYAPFRCAWTPSVCVCPPNPLRRRRRRRLRMWRTSRPTPEPDENAVPTPPMPVPAAAPTAKGRGHAATRPPTRFGAHNR